jgi:hypothetical protein
LELDVNAQISFRDEGVTLLDAHGTSLPFADNRFDLESVVDRTLRWAQSLGAGRSRDGLGPPSWWHCMHCLRIFGLGRANTRTVFLTRMTSSSLLSAHQRMRSLQMACLGCSPPFEYLIDSIVFRFDEEGIHRRRRHVVMNDGRVQWISFMVFLRKKRRADSVLSTHTS